jgi:small GTP-binding protein
MTDISASLKVVVLGDSAVGKTSLALRFVSGTFKLETDSTVGASFITKTLDTAGHRVKFNIWDTAGQERYRAIVRMYYKDVSAALLVYDITKPQSFLNLERWYCELKKQVEADVVVTVVANKEDLLHQEAVSIDEAKAFASRIGARYFRTSCKDDCGVTEMFTGVAQECLARNVSYSHRPRESVALDESTSPKTKSCC